MLHSLRLYSIIIVGKLWQLKPALTVVAEIRQVITWHPQLETREMNVGTQPFFFFFHLSPLYSVRIQPLAGYIYILDGFFIQVKPP